MFSFLFFVYLLLQIWMNLCLFCLCHHRCFEMLLIVCERGMERGREEGREGGRKEEREGGRWGETGDPVLIRLTTHTHTYTHTPQRQWPNHNRKHSSCTGVLVTDTQSWQSPLVTQYPQVCACSTHYQRSLWKLLPLEFGRTNQAVSSCIASDECRSMGVEYDFLIP